MNKEFKPSGYNSVSPYFIVQGAEKWIKLLNTIFGSTESRRYMNNDGTIMHVEVKIDDSIIMLSEASEEYPANQFMMHVYVPDVHTTFKKALNAGCESVQTPERKKGDQDTRGMFKDFAGNMWAVASQNDS